jgi:Protein of unknown function (DUF664)
MRARRSDRTSSSAVIEKGSISRAASFFGGGELPVMRTHSHPTDTGDTVVSRARGSELPTRGLTDSELDRIVDESWDPPVTLGVRLVSVISDGLQHVGQAGFVRGVLERRPM